MASLNEVTVEMGLETYRGRAWMLGVLAKVLPGPVLRWLYRTFLHRVPVARYRIGSGRWETVTAADLLHGHGEDS